MTQRELIGRTVTVLAVAGFAWLLVWFVRQTLEIFILLLVSVILASGLAPIVDRVETWPLPRGARFSRGVAIGLVYLVLFGVIGGVLSLIIVPAVSEAAAFAHRFPDFLVQLHTYLLDLQQRFPFLPNLTAYLDQLPSQVERLAQYGPRAAGVVFGFIGGFAATIAILVFTFYILLLGAGIRVSFLEVFPAKERPRITRVLTRIGVKFGGWLRAQLLLSFTIAAIVVVGLLAVGMPFPFLLGIVAGLGELIPMVGPSLGAAVAILVALSQPLWRLVAVAIFYVIVMNVEPHIIVPRIMSRVVGMSPLLTLVALLSGIKLLGITGGLLAVPVAAALQVVAAEIVKEIHAPDEG